MSASVDLAEWLKLYSTSVAASGMTDDAEKLRDAAEEILRLRREIEAAESKRDEAVSYGRYWEVVGTSR